MKVLITGGCGFVGATLARTLLARGHLAGRSLATLVLADQVHAPADLQADPRVQVRTGTLLTQCDA
ncbi:MAG: NAD-dependent epimerase, partial [Rhodoferax sp.]|nr:NAD-dependent epimerase [Rhodoferax sp.]